MEASAEVDENSGVEVGAGSFFYALMDMGEGYKHKNQYQRERAQEEEAHASGGRATFGGGVERSFGDSPERLSM